MQDEQEVMSETSGNATRGSEEDEWRLEPQGETETLETDVFLKGVEGSNIRVCASSRPQAHADYKGVKVEGSFKRRHYQY